MATRGRADDMATPVRPDARLLWTGGAATALVAALIVVVGVLFTRGVLGIAVLAPERDGAFGDSATTTTYAVLAAVAAILATGLLHLLLVAAPSPLSFFTWIVALVTAVGIILPFTKDARLASQITTAVLNLALGTALISLLPSVARSAIRRAARGGW
jgi:hypothetical protein